MKARTRPSGALGSRRASRRRSRRWPTGWRTPWDRERLAELLDVLDTRPDLLGQPECVGVRRRVIGVTVTVEARTEKAAQEIATRALLEEMWKLGLV